MERRGREKDEEKKTHLCRHIPISRQDIDYERVVRLEDVGYSNIRVWLGRAFWSRSRKRVSFTLLGGVSDRIGQNKEMENGSGLGRDMETDWRKGSETGHSIGVTPENESYTRKTRIATGTTRLSWLKWKKVSWLNLAYSASEPACLH